jgi:secretory lipase
VRFVRGLVAVLVSCGVAGVVVPNAGGAAPPPAPSKDRFYRYTGHEPLARIPPGTVLKRRTVHVVFGPMTTPVAAEQLLYRTRDELGQPSVTVTTVMAPTSAPVRLIGYLSFYDGLDSRCDPSYALAGGTPPGSADQQQAEEEDLLMSWYLDHGFALTVPDFEGTGLHWMAGRESGYNTLDAIRATESYLRVPPTTKVGLSGYSGGAVAADWAAELASAYAPSVNLVGVAMGGVPVNYLHMFGYINGTDEFSAAVPGMLLGLARAYHVDLSHYLSAYGAKAVAGEQGTCIASDFGRYPGLTYQRLLRPAYRSLRRSVLARMLARQTMGTGGTRPRIPMLIGVGNADGKGDGVMVAADVRALAEHYCRGGAPVDYEEYSGAQHQYAGVFFEPETAAFFQARFAGEPYVDNCATA